MWNLTSSYLCALRPIQDPYGQVVSLSACVVGETGTSREAPSADLDLPFHPQHASQGVRIAHPSVPIRALPLTLNSVTFWTVN